MTISGVSETTSEFILKALLAAQAKNESVSETGFELNPADVI